MREWFHKWEFRIAVVWLLMNLIFLMTRLRASTTWISTTTAVYAAWAILISALTLLVYWIDKRRAKQGAWRVRERFLHGLAFFGGWPGAMFGQSILRHKSLEIRFQVYAWLAFLLHAAILLAITKTI